MAETYLRTFHVHILLSKPYASLENSTPQKLPFVPGVCYHESGYTLFGILSIILCEPSLVSHVQDMYAIFPAVLYISIFFAFKLGSGHFINKKLLKTIF